MKILNTLYADIFYDNTTSGLTATTLKNAIDEIANLDVSAATVTLDNSSFTGLLASDTNVQAALATIDAIDGTGIAYDNTETNLIASNTQDAIDALYQLFFPSVTSFDGGAPSSTDYVYSLDGGDPSGSGQTLSADAGDPQGTTIDGGDS